jgi:outer membrane biosynthesis protein TonB
VPRAQPEQSEQTEQREQPEQSEQREQPEQPEQREQRKQPEQREQRKQSEQSEQREQSEQSEQSEQREQPEQPEQSEQSEQLTQFSRLSSAACAASSEPKYSMEHLFPFPSLIQVVIASSPLSCAKRRDHFGGSIVASVASTASQRAVVGSRTRSILAMILFQRCLALVASILADISASVVSSHRSRRRRE